MAQTAREYLAERFQADATALRERVAAMARGTSIPGPDAATSRAMADACEQVATMVSAVVQSPDATVALDALAALIPLLEQRAAAQKQPAVRAVYAGAATRIREIQDAEARAAAAPMNATDDDADDHDDAPDDGAR
ncbi:MAG: hypothetical protein K2R93_15640 [Gemmatimonadaceae bacterium]|nr:hypothetical protein [Gemmatimonadaceae bacterium]